MSLDQIKRHYGAYKAEQQRKIALVFRKVPDDEDYCLVVDIDLLPDNYRYTLEQALESDEARNTHEFSTVLNTRTFSDGSNCLQALHSKGMLKKVKVSDIVMEPLYNQFVDLSTINAVIDNNAGESQIASKESLVVPESDDPKTTAAALFKESKLLEEEAAKKLKMAYELDPSLKPQRGRPPSTRSEEEAAEAYERRKAYNRERSDRIYKEGKQDMVEAAAIERLNGNPKAKPGTNAHTHRVAKQREAEKMVANVNTTENI